MVNDAGEWVGHAWFTIEDRDPGRVVFIYDIEVYEAHRRHGYARAALDAIDDYAREQGCIGVMLHVFGYNTPARELYRPGLRGDQRHHAQAARRGRLGRAGPDKFGNE